MHMPDRDIQNDKFVDKPCDIEYSFVLVDSHKVIVFGVFVPKFGYEPLVTGDRLKHVVETQVARYYNLTFYIKHQLKEALIPADSQSQIKLATLNVRGLNGLKKASSSLMSTVVKPSCKPFKSIFKGAKLYISAAKLLKFR